MDNKYFRGDITNGSDKYASNKFPYWISTCLSFIDSILCLIVSSLLSVIRIMTQTQLLFMSLNS